ncbi:conserved hypothetical protein [Neospora caninum Liverpool]|uniref:Transmembrane protein n=1 Tax=Neospora caninum (strain Liverpool) TaxID=572307 RepID=F0VPZ3_NEOCL|nr:conserved hypothetical protein [Neospora caninum Liverpool]CBZ55790.1 conserved hypothetical protein [Neospora caninum Liverpool]CEL70533.1 TPA: hypothetical protein BN1204_062160 [Neospora caninum Liverpool]|eukprot:XP_003885816.1 conserved hypothetical protein [Neospora caninum Liverpool]
MAAYRRLVPLFFLFSVTYFSLLCAFGLTADSQNDVNSDIQTLATSDFALESGAMEDETSDDVFEDTTDEEADDSIAGSSFSQLTTRKGKAADGRKLFEALQNAMADQAKARAQQEKGQDMFFAAKQAIDSGNDSAMQCVVFRPKRKWGQLLKSLCSKYRKNKPLFSTCQKLAQVVQKTLIEQCGEGSFYDCRRKLGFVIANPTFVHVKDDGAVYLHPKDEYFEFITQVVKDYDAWSAARLMGDSCFYDAMATCNARQNNDTMKRIKKTKDPTYKRDEQNVASRLQALRSVMNVTRTTRMDPLFLALMFQLLDTSHCSPRLLSRLKKPKKSRDEWKYLLVQTMVYWFTVNPTKCEEILAGDPGVPPDPWALKCKAFHYSIKQKKAISPLLTAIAENDSVKSLALAGSLRTDIDTASVDLEDLVLLNAKTAMDTRGVALFLVQKRRLSLALLDFFSRSGLLRKMLSFIVGKMITFLLPETAKLAVVGNLSRALKRGTQSSGPRGLLEQSVLDMMACGHEAVIYCMTSRQHLARTAVRAFLNVAETAARKEDREAAKKDRAAAKKDRAAAKKDRAAAKKDREATKKDRAAAKNEDVAVAQKEDVAESKRSTSLIQVSINRFGSTAPPPPSSSDDFSDFDEVDLEAGNETLSPLAQEFVTFMQNQRVDVYRRAWDEGDAHRSSFDKFRTLIGVPRSRQAWKRALVICTWGLGLATFIMGIVGLALFPVGHLFAYLGALSLALGVGVLLLIPVINYGILWANEYNRIAFVGGQELGRVPQKRVRKTEPKYTPGTRFSNLLQTQLELERAAQENPTFDSDEDDGNQGSR